MTWKSWIVHNQICILQSRRAAMSDELSPSHPQVGIGLFPMSDVAVGAILGIGLGVKGVARRVNANKPHSAMNGIEQLLFSCCRHGRILVGSCSRQIAGGEEDDRGV